MEGEYCAEEDPSRQQGDEQRKQAAQRVRLKRYPNKLAATPTHPPSHPSIHPFNQSFIKSSLTVIYCTRLNKQIVRTF